MFYPHSHSIEGYRIMQSAIERVAASQALAKAIAYHNAGKAAQASEWAQRLIAMLRAAGIDVSRTQGPANDKGKASSPLPTGQH
jgi:GH25 family lysozyme M1 (1,4-beta-N-acetylmuramidase)